jgi:hypothetical protein
MKEKSGCASRTKEEELVKKLDRDARSERLSEQFGDSQGPYGDQQLKQPQLVIVPGGLEIEENCQKVEENQDPNLDGSEQNVTQKLTQLPKVFFGEELYQRLQNFQDYPVSMNTLFGGGMTLSEIKNVNSKNRTVVRRREYVTNLRKDAGITKYTFNMNPSNKVTFPILSEMAKRFKFFKFTGLVFEYQPRVIQGGLAKISFQTAMLESAPQVMTLKGDFHNCDISEVMDHPIICYPARERADYTIKEYEKRGRPFGQFMVQIVSTEVLTGVVGQLWVSYEVQMWGDRPFRTKDEFKLYKAERALLKADVQYTSIQRKRTDDENLQKSLLEGKAVDMLVSYQSWLANVLNGMNEAQLEIERLTALKAGFQDPMSYRMSVQLRLIRSHLGLEPREQQ